MTDKGVWKIIATLIILFSIGVGIWAYQKAQYEQGIRDRYKAWGHRNERELKYDQEDFKSGRISYEEYDRRTDARREERSKFFWEHDKIIGMP